MAGPETPEPAGLPPVRAIPRGDPDYPPALLDLADPPDRIHVQGALPAFHGSAAIVGARAASPYGLAVARRLAADLARVGVAVVSGLARGIDTAAHAGALDAGGATLAVLPFPIGEVPETGAALADRVARRGALLSERSPGDPSYRSVFLERNRLIAALARVVVVVEAAERSGSLSTAAAAGRLGRPLLAVPGDVDRPTSRGTHALLRAGAGLCTEAADVLAAMASGEADGGERAAAADDRSAAPAGASLELRLRGALESGEPTTDALAEAMGAPVGETLAALFALQLAGVVEPRPGQRWRRRA